MTSIKFTTFESLTQIYPCKYRGTQGISESKAGKLEKFRSDGQEYTDIIFPAVKQARTVSP